MRRDKNGYPMSRTALISMITVTLLVSATSVRAELLQDVCAKRAENLSGYKHRGLSIGDRRGRLRLSGSASIGVSTTTGDGNSTGLGGNNHDSGDDRRQDAKVDSYWKAFDDCMRRQ